MLIRTSCGSGICLADLDQMESVPGLDEGAQLRLVTTNCGCMRILGPSAHSDWVRQIIWQIGLAAVDITNPQSWNRYAYVGNSPLALADPSGLCPLCGWPGGPKSDVYYQPHGYEYNQLDLMGDLFDNGQIGWAEGPCEADCGDGIGIHLLYPVYAIDSFEAIPSGGAQVAANAYAALPPEIQSQITFIGYFSPGVGPLTAFSGLPSGTMDTFSAHGHGWKDFVATFWARVTGQAGMTLPCSHDVQCEYETAPINVVQNVTPCPKQQLGRGGWGGGNFFSATGVLYRIGSLIAAQFGEAKDNSTVLNFRIGLTLAKVARGPGSSLNRSLE